MSLYIEKSNGFETWSGSLINNIRYPMSIEQYWSNEELNAIGLYKPVEADPVPEGKFVVETTVVRIRNPETFEDEVKFVHVLENIPSPSTNPVDYPLLPWQFKAMVEYLEKHNDIYTVIASMSNPLERAVAKSRYENASSYVYDDALMQSMRVAVGLTIEEFTEAWMIAKDL